MAVRHAGYSRYRNLRATRHINPGQVCSGALRNSEVLTARRVVWPYWVLAVILKLDHSLCCNVAAVTCAVAPVESPLLDLPGCSPIVRYTAFIFSWQLDVATMAVCQLKTPKASYMNSLNDDDVRHHTRIMHTTADGGRLKAALLSYCSVSSVDLPLGSAADEDTPSSIAAEIAAEITEDTEHRAASHSLPTLLTSSM